MAGKGDKDRGSPAKRATSKVWCNKCNKLKGGSCNCSPLPCHSITNVLAEACGYDVCKCGGTDCHKMSCESKCKHRFAEQIFITGNGRAMKLYKCCDCGAEFEE